MEVLLVIYHPYQKYLIQNVHRILIVWFLCLQRGMESYAHFLVEVQQRTYCLYFDSRLDALILCEGFVATVFKYDCICIMYYAQFCLFLICT